jgi:heme/copper-type cytochrome/quinol oxidase subunit 2
MTTYSRYGYVFVISLFYAMISLFYEYAYEPDKKQTSWMIVILLRLLHTIILMYMSLYFLFFYNVQDQMHHYIYLSVYLGIILLWSIFNCCILSQYEWKFYSGSVYTRKNNEHPHINFMNRKPIDILATISPFVILYVLKVKFSYKLLYVIAMIYLIMIFRKGTKFQPITANNIYKNISENFSFEHFQNSVKSTISGERSIETFI